MIHSATEGFIGDATWQARRADKPDDLTIVPGSNRIRVKIDRRTHYMRYEDESEESVTIVVEKKDEG